MPFTDFVKERALRIDPDCWISYSGKSKKEKQLIDYRRTKALAEASLECLAADEPITEKIEGA